jgi:hypothetical protein
MGFIKQWGISVRLAGTFKRGSGTQGDVMLLHMKQEDAQRFANDCPYAR